MITVEMNALYTGSASLESVNRRLMEDKKVSRANKKALNWFLNECSAQGLGWQRLRKYAANFHTILALSDWKFDLKTATEKDLKELKADGLVMKNANRKYQLTFTLLHCLTEPTERTTWWEKKRVRVGVRHDRRGRSH